MPAVLLPKLLEEESVLCKGIADGYTLPLHVGAIFVVLFASVLGTALPIITMFVPFLQRNRFVFVVGKTAATGVLLSVSTIHLLGDGTEAFEESCVPEWITEIYPAWNLFLLVVAALSMHFVDYKLMATGEKWMRRQRAKESENNKDDMCNDLLTGAADPSSHGKDSGDENVNNTSGNSAKQVGCQSEQHHPVSMPTGHEHAHVSVPMDITTLQRIIAAVCMEFGITLHSLFVGLDVGLTTDEHLKPLLIALVFHQMFEGMSMGSRLVDAKFNVTLDVILAMVFSISAPIGMAAATIAVSVRPDAMSGTVFVLVMAVLDCLCAGILLYLAFNLLFIDFTAEMAANCAYGTPRRGLKRFCMFVALWTGMIMMAIVGKWC